MNAKIPRRSGMATVVALLLSACAGLETGGDPPPPEILLMRPCLLGEGAGFKSRTTDWHCCNNVVFVAEGDSNVESTSARGISTDVAVTIGGALAAELKARNYTVVDIDLKVERVYVAQHWFREHCGTHTAAQAGGCEGHPEVVKRKVQLRGKIKVEQQIGGLAQGAVRGLFRSLQLGEAKIVVGSEGTVVESGLIERCQDEQHNACHRNTQNTNLTLGPDRNDAGVSPWKFAGSPEGSIPSSPGGGSPDGGSRPDGGTPVGCVPNGNPCHDCLAERCCLELRTCLENPNCRNAHGALERCLGSAADSSQRMACWEEFTTTDEARMFTNCANRNCGSRCF